MKITVPNEFDSSNLDHTQIKWEYERLGDSHLWSCSSEEAIGAARLIVDEMEEFQSLSIITLVRISPQESKIVGIYKIEVCPWENNPALSQVPIHEIVGMLVLAFLTTDLEEYVKQQNKHRMN